MSLNDPQPPAGPRDPEHLLARGLRATTPGFESRFDELRRRLAREPRTAPMWRQLAAALRRPGLVAVAAAALVLVAVFLVRVRTSPAPGLPAADPDAWYADAVAFDASLRDGLVLADAETRETLTWIATEPKEGGS